MHPASTREHAKQGRLDKALAFAICGIAALHSNQGLRTRREDSAIWARMTEQLIWQHLEAPSLPRLQALLLLINYLMETGSFHKAFMFSSLASRAAITIGLHNERPELDFVSQETRRRTMWSLRLTDRYFSLGLTEFELFPLDNINIQPPSYEGAFGDSQLASPGTRVTPEADDLGAYSLFVRLETVRREVMRLTRRITSLADEPQMLASRTKELSDQLADIASQMPMPPALTSSRISALLTDPWLPRHIAFNLSWHQCHCDLHRLVLAGYSRAIPVPALAQLDEHHKSNATRLCLEHAIAITKTLSTLYQLSVSPPLLEYDTALCAYHAIRLTLDMCGSRQNNPTDHASAAPDVAIRQAEIALAALKRLFPSSPLVRPIIDNAERLMSSRESSLPSSSPTLSLHGESFEGAIGNDAKVVEKEKSQSPDTNAKLRDSEEHVSWAERTRQKLAIHSLLRQNNVSDDEESGDDGFETDVADRASLPTRSGGSFSVRTSAGGITRNITPTDYAAARPEPSCFPISSRRNTAEANQPAEPYQKPFGIPSPGDEAQTEKDGSFEFENDGSPHDGLNGPNRRLQFPLFPWFGGTGPDGLLVL